MQKLLLLLLLTSLVFSAFRPSAPATYTFDPAASRLTWTGYAEIGAWAPSGAVQLRGGSLTTDGRGRLTAGQLEVAMATLVHENADMQSHLRSADFFDVEQFPVASFRLRTLARDSVFGALTLKGVTQPLAFPLTVSRTAAGLRLVGSARVDRTRFGVRYNSARFFSGLGDRAIRDDFRLDFDIVARASGQPTTRPRP